MDLKSCHVGRNLNQSPPKHRYDGLDLSDEMIRAALVECHPVLSRSIILQTPPINELYTAIRRIVLLREVGGYAIAKSGVGKSYALNMVSRMLQISLPGLVVLVHNTQNEQQISIRAFFKQFLGTVAHPNKKGETWDLRERVSNILVDEARHSGRDLVVLLIDEAQAMSMQDFLFLKDVSNELEREGVQLISFLMAQEPDFTGVVNMLKEERRLDLIGRFAMREIRYRALGDMNDIKTILLGIDTNCFPEGSEWTWTRFFFEKSWDSGFRMLNEAPALLSAVQHIRPNGSRNLELPARQLFLAIRAFMYDFAELGGTVAESTKGDAWADALRYGNVEEGMKLMQEPRRSQKRRIKT